MDRSRQGPATELERLHRRLLWPAPGGNRPQWEKMDAADFAGFWLRQQRIGRRGV
jgi:hypothetical protein